MKAPTVTSRRSRSSADHLADAVAEVVPVRLRQVVDLVRAHVHAAGGDLVQLGLPDVGAGAVDQGDVGLAALAQRVAERGGQFEPAGAAADDDDLVPAGALGGGLAERRWRGHADLEAALAGRAQHTHIGTGDRLTQTAVPDLRGRQPAPCNNHPDEQEQHVDRAAQVLRPHTPLPAYYGDEAEREQYLRRIFDDTAADYDRIERVLAFGSGRWYRHQALKRAQLAAGAEVLDVGIGTGLVAREALTLIGPQGRLVGVDPSPGMMDEVALPGVELVCGKAEALPRESASSDFVSMGYALRHITDVAAAFSEFHRVLRPGGRLLVLEITKPRGRVGTALLKTYMRAVVPLIAARRLAPARHRGAVALLLGHDREPASRPNRCSPPCAPPVSKTCSAMSSSASSPSTPPSSRPEEHHRLMTVQTTPTSETLEETCDVLVIGGGPAGSTIAALLATQGRQVVLLEKAHHPRFHIGESLLPSNVELFERLGVREQVEQIGMPKFGIEFVSPDHEHRSAVEFAEAWDKSQPSAWQVRRSELDELLFRNAATRGATTLEGCRVREVDFDADGATVQAELDDGARRRWRAALRRRRLGPRHLPRQQAALQGEEPQAQQLGAVRPLHRRAPPAGQDGRQHQHHVVPARLVLVHSAGRRHDQRRRGVLALLPEVAQQAAAAVLRRHHRAVPRAGRPAEGRHAGRRRGARDRQLLVQRDPLQRRALPAARRRLHLHRPDVLVGRLPGDASAPSKAPTWWRPRSTARLKRRARASVSTR